MKNCKNCEIDKKLIEFKKDKKYKDGYKSNCKDCILIDLKNGFKECNLCFQKKEINQYKKDKYIKGGYTNQCKKCMKEKYNKNYKCKDEKCKKLPVYNFKDEKELYCSIHRLDGMINVIIKKCKEKDCDKIPFFNFKDKNNGLYCKEHKTVDMIDVKSKKCKNENCNIRPSFNYEGKKKRLYCSVHKLKDMISIVNKKCKEKSCYKQPIFNFKNKKNGLYCKEHKTVDMIDVKSKKCKNENCNIRPTFNYKNENSGLYCKEHKLKRMVDISHKNQMCIKCNFTRGIKFLDNYCSVCYKNEFPDSEYSKKQRVMKQTFINYIYKEEFKESYDWDSVDKTIDGTCNNRRPDYYKEFYTYSLILEIDENQHKYYNKQCEINRINELSIGFNHRPIVCIRFNPDNYINKNGEKIDSIFNLTEKNGKLKINRDKCIKRLIIVNKMVKYYSNVKNVDILSPYKEVKLFFDKE